jgi:AmmeMemoRadiSam system protein A
VVVNMLLESETKISRCAVPETSPGAIVFALLMPHAPVLVPGVGGSRGGAAAASGCAMREAAERMLRAQPRDVVLISPHSPRKPGAFGLWTGDFIDGSFADFGTPQTAVSLPNDRVLVDAIVEAAHARGVPTWFIPDRHLDHGALVPLWFLGEAGWHGPTVVVSLAYSGKGRLVQLGEAIEAAARASHRRVAVIASGDMSHRLTSGAPCGYHPQAHLFDETFIRLVRDGDYRTIPGINPELRELAAEDVVDTTIVALAAAQWNASGHEVLHYAGPYGVGYGVAVLSAPEIIPKAPHPPAHATSNHAGGILPAIARRSVSTALQAGSSVVPGATGEYLRAARGAFVTIHRPDGQLRGCVGSLKPACANLVAETWRNARLAAFRDGRFTPISPDELGDLQFEVSVIQPAHKVVSTAELDPEHYGVIVRTPDGRCGVLLPGIKEIITPAEQLSIARQKGGIGLNEPISMERFAVDHFEESF